MKNLKSKHIIVGITGSIAVYKAAILVRLLVKSGAEVRVIMTDAAKSFVAPLTFSTLSKKPVYSGFSNTETGEWTNHVDLGLWADLLLIAPCTENTIAKMANGICDNLLSAVYLSAKCPVFVAPAMDLDMYQHPATKRNLKLLQQDKVTLIPAEHGELASGLIGEGRMAEPENIMAFLSKSFLKSKDSFKKKVLITAGPTHEAIDPVRFIGNRSSGKMGFALAEEFADRGAQVNLISGPVSLTTLHPNIHVIYVDSAEEMFTQVQKIYKQQDIFVMAAAVADYTPTIKESRKIKKTNANLNLSLTRTQDILSWLGQHKKNGQFLAGFALETDDEKANALGKLRSKKADMIVLNSLNDEGAGFGHDTNKITIFRQGKEPVKYSLKTKDRVAMDIVDAICKRQ